MSQHCRWKGASGYCLFHGRRCPDNEEEDDPLPTQSSSPRHGNDFSGCAVTSDEIQRGAPVKAVWCLKNISSLSNLEALVHTSGCVVEAGEGGNKTRLRFYLESAAGVSGGGCPAQGQGHFEKHLSLGCAVLNGGDESRLAFAVKVDRLVEGSLHFQANVLTERVVAFKTEDDRQGKLIEKQLLTYITAHLRNNGQTHRETYCFASNKDLCFGITVIPFQSSGAQGATATEGGAGVEAIQAGSSESGGDEGLAQDLRKMLADPNNFSDVVLETKDGMDISAHKFILAARSPVMKQLIQEESFGETIPIGFDVNPIRIILQWMYTGKLTSEATGPVIEEVVLAAEKYELVEMLKQLDKEMISACNTGNMFKLLEIAKKNGMSSATEQITGFIKRSI